MAERIIDVVCNGDSVTNCAVMLGGITCDGYRDGMQIGVFSHFHQDHIRSIPECIAAYNSLIIHPITFEGINALHPGMRYREQWVTQSYDTAYAFEAGMIRLLKANHIPGSSQVHVESDGETMLYSGDFSYPDIQIRNADYLVIDSTHGDPWYDGKTDRNHVMNSMFKYVEDRLESSPHLVIKAHSGTLQEIVHHFEIRHGKKMVDTVSFVMGEKQRDVLYNIYRDEVEEIRDIVEYDSHEYWDLINRNKKCVIFTANAILDTHMRGLHKIIVDMYRFTRERKPIIPFHGGCRFNLAAHASIDGIYKYVESVNPKHVVTDNSRSQFAGQLAKLIEQRFPNIKTECRPSPGVYG